MPPDTPDYEAFVVGNEPCSGLASGLSRRQTMAGIVALRVSGKVVSYRVIGYHGKEELEPLAST